LRDERIEALRHPFVLWPLHMSSIRTGATLAQAVVECFFLVPAVAIVVDLVVRVWTGKV
jgi:hypothetical protein